MECEGTALVVTQHCHAFVNPYQIPQTPQDLSDRLGILVGKVIDSIDFGLVTSSDENQSACLRILIDDGTSLVVKHTADQDGEEHCACFAIETAWEAT